MSTPAQITIRPDRPVNAMAFPSSAKRLAGERCVFGAEATSPSCQLFGTDGLTFDDVVDAVNPLQHIPGVSSLYEGATGDVASTASKLIGGTLIGGPVGFLAALGNVIFEQETGHGIVGAMVAGLTGADQPTTQLAAKEAPSTAAMAATEETVIAPVSLSTTAPAEILPPAALPEKHVAAPPRQTVAALTDDLASQHLQDQATLSLFGDTASAHASYRKAQFKPYLQDVTTSLVL